MEISGAASMLQDHLLPLVKFSTRDQAHTIMPLLQFRRGLRALVTEIKC